MISHNNLGQIPQTRSNSRLLIANVNNKDEAMMFNVPRGYVAYLFEYRNPLFYVKSCDEFTGQISFFEYKYDEVEPQPVPDPTSYVTRNDLMSFKDDIMQSINGLLLNNQNQNRGGMNNEQHIPKTDGKSARSTKGQPR